MNELFPLDLVSEFVSRECGVKTQVTENVSPYDPSSCVLPRGAKGVVNFWSPSGMVLGIRSLLKIRANARSYTYSINGQSGKNCKSLAFFGERGKVLVPSKKALRAYAAKNPYVNQKGLDLYMESADELKYSVFQDYRYTTEKLAYHIDPPQADSMPAPSSVVKKTISNQKTK